MSFVGQDVEIKTLSMLKVLSDSREPLRARVITQRLRMLTEQEIEEVRSALVKDKVAFAISIIESLAFRTDFDFHKKTGLMPVNISLFPRKKFDEAI